MRYRPFGASGKAVSAISLLLREAPNMTTPHAWRTLAFSAMECGVNCFEITAGSEIMALGFGEALRAVERRLIAIGWRIHGDPRKVLTAEAISNSVRGGLARTGAGYFDVLMLDEAAFETLAPDAHGYLADLRAAGLVLQMGVVGDGDSIDACIESGLFDVLATPFSLTSDWKARRRIKDASARDMTMIAYDPFPAALCRPVGGGSIRTGLFKRAEPLAGAGTYAFLHQTHGWSAEEVCLAYALTEPAFASVQVEQFRGEAIERLALITDKDLPTGVAAQIEMARFSADNNEQRRA
ncbi:aldo/keto reductase [Phenylobacterium sp.]|uniref:aldo/keto reductase n=1 Tax=Phenylobacterium sp. TaxID=1871053 RepID=UPI0030F4020F